MLLMAARVKFREVEILNGETTVTDQLDYGFVPTLLAMMPCPLKVPVEEDFARRNEAGQWEELDTTRVVFEGNATQTGFYDLVKQYKHEDELPDLIISPGISSFFHPDFRRRFLEQGVFRDVTQGWNGSGSRFADLDLADPKGWYTMLCVNPLVMVADHTRLGGLPLPSSWSDLLKPEFKGMVSMRGKKDDFCETTLLTLRHIYGLQAVEQLGEAVRSGLHPAQMVKTAGTSNPDAAAILIMPYFYARSIPRKDKVSVIWPSEGAIASPVFLLAKASAHERVKVLTDYLTGTHVSGLYESASFPALNPHVESKLPEGAALLWMGWDLVWNSNIQEAKLETHGRFLKGFRRGIQR